VIETNVLSLSQTAAVDNVRNSGTILGPYLVTQLSFDFDSTAIRPLFDAHSTAIRRRYDHSTTTLRL